MNWQAFKHCEQCRNASESGDSDVWAQESCVDGYRQYVEGAAASERESLAQTRAERKPRASA
jgi:hypothetical protein